VKARFSRRQNGRYTDAGLIIVADNEVIFVVTSIIRGGERIVARLGYDGMVVSQSSSAFTSMKVTLVVPGDHMNVESLSG